jgi:hypothetical protein
MEVKILSIHGSGLKREVKFRPSFITQNKTNRNKISCQDLIAGIPKIFFWIFPELKNRNPPKNNAPGIRRFPAAATCPE